MLISLANAVDGMKNIAISTLDSSELLEEVSKRIQKNSLKNLASKKDYKSIVLDVETLRIDISEIVKLQKDARSASQNLKSLIEKYNSSEARYNKKMKRIYKANRNIKRVVYYVVSHKLDEDYTLSLKNALVDKYAIEKYDQSTLIKESNGNMSYSNVITTNKEFGQMQIESLEDFTYREQGFNVKLVKVTQSPFVSSKTATTANAFENSVDKFEMSESVTLYEIEDIKKLSSEYLSKLLLPQNEQKLIVETIKKSVNVKKANKKVKKVNKSVLKALKKIAKTHDKYVVGLNNASGKINAQIEKTQKKDEKLKEKIQSATNIAKHYSIKLNLEELNKLIILTPKLYSEYVELGEEREFVIRKIKSYLSKVTISELSQSETLTNSYNLQTKNINKQKFVEYKSLHFLAFTKGKELSMLVFSTIELEDKISKSDLIRKSFKYTSLTFVPIKQRFKTIFVATTEITLGIVKEFVETNKQHKYFDKYCLEDSPLPEDAKNFKSVASEFYEYPAVCFKAEKVDGFMKWLSKKTRKNIVFPSSEEWSYVASNANSSDYCWGNETIQELNEDELRPENIYYEDNLDTTIEAVKQHKKSILGIYDMCGNVHELVKDDDELAIKGTSYISFLENSNAPALEYDDGLNTSVGIRAFYIKEK